MIFISIILIFFFFFLMIFLVIFIILHHCHYFYYCYYYFCYHYLFSHYYNSIAQCVSNHVSLKAALLPNNKYVDNGAVQNIFYGNSIRTLLLVSNSHRVQSNNDFEKIYILHLLLWCLLHTFPLHSTPILLLCILPHFASYPRSPLDSFSLVPILSLS